MWIGKIGGGEGGGGGGVSMDEVSVRRRIIEPNRTEPNRTESNQIEPNQTESNPIEPNRQREGDNAKSPNNTKKSMVDTVKKHGKIYGVALESCKIPRFQDLKPFLQQYGKGMPYCSVCFDIICVCGKTGGEPRDEHPSCCPVTSSLLVGINNTTEFYMQANTSESKQRRACSIGKTWTGIRTCWTTIIQTW